MPQKDPMTGCYRYPDGSTPANNAAIRRVVAKVCKWEDENPGGAVP